MTTTTIEERVSKLEGAYDHLATKSDLAQLETKLVQMVGDLESKLTWRLLVALFLQAGLIVALIKLLP